MTLCFYGWTIKSHEYIESNYQSIFNQNYIENKILVFFLTISQLKKLSSSPFLYIQYVYCSSPYRILDISVRIHCNVPPDKYVPWKFPNPYITYIYRKPPNISPELIFVRKHFLVGLNMGGGGGGMGAYIRVSLYTEVYGIFMNLIFIIFFSRFAHKMIVEFPVPKTTER